MVMSVIPGDILVCIKCGRPNVMTEDMTAHVAASGGNLLADNRASNNFQQQSLAKKQSPHQRLQIFFARR
jgi:hypothetical protein